MQEGRKEGREADEMEGRKEGWMEEEEEDNKVLSFVMVS